MTLGEILEVCRDEHASDWPTIPGGEYGTDLLAGIYETRDRDQPALTALEHNYRAVYIPEPSIGIGWGMDSESWK